jgi:nucleoside-diphosphate-sugar epimerase
LNLLVLGCNGFIGGHLAKYFHEQGFQIFGCDMQDNAPVYIRYFKTNQQNEGLDGFLLNQPIDYCINAAGSGNVSFSIQNPMADFGSNTLGTIRILDVLRLFAPSCKYLHISTAAVYGNPASLPVSEDFPIQPVSPYGYHKWMSEIICMEYNKLYSVPVAIVRIFSIYGVGQKKLLLWDICNKLINNDEIKLYGTGNESRDFIHISDFAALLNCIIQANRFEGDVFNTGTGEEIKIKEIATIVEEYFKHAKKIIFSGENKAGDPKNWKADIDKVKNLGFTPSVSLKEGIFDYLNWYSTLKNE